MRIRFPISFFLKSFAQSIGWHQTLLYIASLTCMRLHEYSWLIGELYILPLFLLLFQCMLSLRGPWWCLSVLKKKNVSYTAIPSESNCSQRGSSLTLQWFSNRCNRFFFLSSMRKHIPSYFPFILAQLSFFFFRAPKWSHLTICSIWSIQVEYWICSLLSMLYQNIYSFEHGI